MWIFPSSEIKPILSLIHIHVQNFEKLRGISENIYNQSDHYKAKMISRPKLEKVFSGM